MDNYKPEAVECGNTLGGTKKTSTVDKMITRVRDAIGRTIDMRTRLAQRNDRLFGCIPCGVDGEEKVEPDGAVYQLEELIEMLHQRMTDVELELNRQDGLV